MSTCTNAKKPAPKDWHNADIVAALHKAGWSVRRLSMKHGYASPGTLSNALRRPWPKGEQIIASAIGINPADIWPSRYANGSAKRAPATPKAGA